MDVLSSETVSSAGLPPMTAVTTTLMGDCGCASGLQLLAAALLLPTDMLQPMVLAFSKDGCGTSGVIVY